MERQDRKIGCESNVVSSFLFYCRFPCNLCPPPSLWGILGPLGGLVWSDSRINIPLFPAGALVDKWNTHIINVIGKTSDSPATTWKWCQSDCRFTDLFYEPSEKWTTGSQEEKEIEIASLMTWCPRYYVIFIIDPFTYLTFPVVFGSNLTDFQLSSIINIVFYIVLTQGLMISSTLAIWTYTITDHHFHWILSGLVNCVTPLVFPSKMTAIGN